MTSLRRLFLAPWLIAAACAIPISVGAQDKEPQRSALDASLFYQILAGELSANQGDSSSAFQLLLDAGRKTNDAKLFERAVEIALRARAGDSALQAAQAWSRAQPGSREANRYVLQVLISLNRVAETADPIRRELTGLPTSEKIAMMTLLPRNFARVSDKKLAAGVIEQALAGELGNSVTGPAAWFAVGTLRLASGQLAGATEAAQKGLALNPRAREPVLLALGLMDPANPTAERLVVNSLNLTPQPELRMAYTRKLLESQRINDARAQIVTLTAEAPDYAEGWLVLGTLEFQERRPAAAQEALNKYLALVNNRTPVGAALNESDGRGRTQAYLLLAQIAEQAQQYTLARSYLDKIGDAQEDLHVATRRAALMAREGQLEQALALVRAFPEKEPGDARNKLTAEVQLLRDAKQFSAVYALLKQATAQSPQDTDLLYDFAMAAEKLDKLEEMERLLRRVIADKPDYHHAYNALGYSLAERNLRLGEARQLIQKALEFAPDDPYIVDSLAWVEFRSGNKQEALRLLQLAFKAKPDAEIAAHLGEVLWALDQRSQARKIWEEGLLLSPDNETLKETIKRLSTP